MSWARTSRVFSAAWILLSASFSTGAGEAGSPPCFEDQVIQHVREQFAIYGPRSSQFEFFGFIYLKDGRVESAVTRGVVCRDRSECVVNTVFALRRVPRGAKVLGEWHTHPDFHQSDTLTTEDVLGAQANRHVRCYNAFYSNSNGDFYRWDIEAPNVAAAMASRTRLGNYRLLGADYLLVRHGRIDGVGPDHP
jgi:hypothetical protein